MSYIEYFVSFLLYFGALFALAMTAGQLMLERKRVQNWVLITFLTTIALYLFLSGCVHLSFVNGNLDLFAIFSIYRAFLCYLVGILQAVYIRSILYSDFTFKAKQLSHCVPAFAIMLVLSFFLVQDYLLVSGTITGGGVLYKKYKLIANGFLYFSIVVCLVYLIYSIFPVLKSIRSDKTESFSFNKRTVVYSFSILTFVVLAGGFLIFKKITDLQIREVLNLFIPVILILVYVLGNRYPEFVHILQLKIERMQYTRSLTEGLSVDSVIKDLNRLMKEEKLFCRENISLVNLAK